MSSLPYGSIQLWNEEDVHTDTCLKILCWFMYACVQQWKWFEEMRIRVKWTWAAAVGKFNAMQCWMGRGDGNSWGLFISFPAISFFTASSIALYHCGPHLCYYGYVCTRICGSSTLTTAPFFLMLYHSAMHIKKVSSFHRSEFCFAFIVIITVGIHLECEVVTEKDF